MKALVLFSGGLDSSTCLALAVHQYGADNVTALFCHYGQKHSKEAESAQTVAFHYGVQLKSLDLSLIFADSDCSLLKQSTQDIPLESYEMQLKSTGGKPVSTYVPFRNGALTEFISFNVVHNLNIYVLTTDVYQLWNLYIHFHFF